MTATLIALISISIGIIGANLTGFIFRKYNFGLIGNTIAGVFGSIFFIKSFGRLGFSPMDIINSGFVNYKLFILNSVVSFCGGALFLIFIYLLNTKLLKGAQNE